LLNSLGTQGHLGRKVPTILGWCENDGADMVYYDYPTRGYSMTEDEYHTYWNRFRDSGFEAERLEHFNVNDFDAQGKSSAAFMAADNVATTSLYSCPIHKLLDSTPFG
jgi:hypothetical protein